MTSSRPEEKPWTASSTRSQSILSCLTVSTSTSSSLRRWVVLSKRVPGDLLHLCSPRLPPQDLLSHRKQGPGFLSRMGETVRAVASSVRGLKSRPEEFMLMHDYVEEFSSKITSVDKITQRITKEQRGSSCPLSLVQLLTSRAVETGGV